tara:strand:+ start:1399 stop:1710 length:312 start_codon:yes stop_codon:yes gene_type:complete
MNIPPIEDETILTRTRDIWADIRRERKRQDAEYGGPDHDDRQSFADWMVRIVKQLGKAFVDPFDAATYRQQMVRIAALAVAAIEWCDRREVRDLTVATTEGDE